MVNTSERSRKAAETRKAHDPHAFEAMGQKGAAARHSKSPEEESELARKAAHTRKEQDPDAFRKMGERGGHAVHSSEEPEEEE